MPATLLKDLDPRLQKQVEAAQKAVEKGDVEYAFGVCSNILQRHPDCVEVRKLLRTAQYKKAGPYKGGGLSKLFAVTRVPFMPKMKTVEKEPQKYLDLGEAMLSKNPYDSVGNKTLGLAATALGHHATAAYAYSEVRRFEPDDIENLVSLGWALQKSGQGQEAIKVAEQIAARNPGNTEAGEIIKQASVSSALNAGWEGNKGSARDMLKNSQETLELEKLNSAFKDEATLKLLIDRTLKRIESEPEDVKAHAEIADYYKQLNDLDQAILWIQKARALPKGATDAALEQKEVSYATERLRKLAEAAQAEAEKNPSNQALAEEAARLQKELLLVRRKNIESLVEKYPTNNDYRYELGLLHLADGKTDDAARQFQMATRSPKVRPLALLNLAKCFKQGRKYDLAADQLETTKKETPGMDKFKMEVIYELADTYEKLGKREQAVAEYKIIYSVDIGYRDVEAKINAFYSGN